MTIYKIVNKINGKMYIGKTELALETRMKKHIRCAQKKKNRHLYDAMNCYGIENFEIIAMETCTTSKELCDREKYWIQFYNTMDRNIGYNMQEGGTGGRLTPELHAIIGKKVAIARQLHGYKHSKETRRLIGLSHIGMTIPNDVRQKISQTLRETNKHRDFSKVYNHMRGKVGEKHPFYGHHHSELSRKKISEACLGKSYEELYGYEEAQKLREMRRKCWLKENNINYVQIDSKQLKDLVDLNKSNSEIGRILNFTNVKNKFKELFNIAIDDYRKDNNIKIKLPKYRRRPRTLEERKKISNAVKQYFANR